MRSLGSAKLPRLVSGAVAAFATAALVVAGASTAAASDRANDRAGPATSDDAVHAALERDLGLDRAQVEEMVDALAGVDELATGLEADLDTSFGGSWFDHDAGTLVVGVTDAAAAEAVRSAGAQPQLVRYSQQELEEVQRELDALAQQRSAALSDAFSWTVDVQSNQVVLTVQTGTATNSLSSQFGDALRVEESSQQPQLLNHDGNWLDGGVQYNNTTAGFSCSVGFNATEPGTGDRYFLTAGHCGSVGNQTAHGGTSIGPFAQVRYPGSDDATVHVTNSSWQMGPYVWTYGGAVTITGSASSPVGTPVCKSGMTTGLTCGTITDKNVTVNYGDGPVTGMGQHNACAEPGDSGGSTYSTGSNLAEGLTSGGQMIGGQCLERFGMENVTFYQEITDSLNAYNLQLMTG